MHDPIILGAFSYIHFFFQNAFFNAVLGDDTIYTKLAIMRRDFTSII